jgi:hypothetical protein
MRVTNILHLATRRAFAKSQDYFRSLMNALTGTGTAASGKVPGTPCLNL